MSPGSESPGVSGVLSNTRDADLLIDDNHAIASDLQHHVEVPMQLGQLEQALNMLSMSTMRPDPLPNGVDRPLSLSYSPLTRENFTKAYFQQWIPKHPVDQTMLKVEGCEIDLYQLHYEVMSQNGYLIRSQHTAPKQPFQFVPTLVISQEQWPVIAGRLGFVNFPAYGHEPARSGPGIAVHIERAYKQCLQDFDSLYLCHLFQWRRLRTLEQKVNGGDMSAGPSGPADPKGLSDIKDPKALNEIISYAALSAPELQARGVPDHIIALVEKHRDQLKATLQQQRDFANIQIAAQGQPRNRQAEADGAKTDEDTVKFLEQMSSWLTQIGGEGDGQDILKTEIAEVTAGASDKQRER
ncbi:hypothetical protein BD309DRAFT_980789 [Dichomitus squalens]|nr:hypothetical protein BD309DRAFT_980789 [Dichomitus squalens]